MGRVSSIATHPSAVDVEAAFVRLRRMLTEHDALRLAIEGLERRVGRNERDIQMALKVMQQVFFPPEQKLPPKTQKMGFGPPRKK